MKVAIFTDNDFGKVNGVTTTLRAVQRHAPADIRTRIYTCEDTGVDEDQYFAARAFGVSIPFYREKMFLPPLLRFREQVRKDRADLVHFTTPGPVGLAAMYVCSTLGLPMVGSFHTDLAEYARLLSGSDRIGRLMQEYVCWPYGKCRQILVPSAATRETMIRGNINPARIGLWTQGVCTDQFAPGRRSAALRAQWDVSDERPALLYVGRVSKERGLDLLPALSERLKRAQLRHRLIIVGDGPMRDALSDRCAGAVFTGALSHADVAVTMASADLFVFPSRIDTAGNVVLEAQASGLPVLVTDEGGARDNIIDGGTGCVCADLRAFTRRVSELVWNPGRRTRMARDARAYAETRQWPAALEPLYRAYREATVALEDDATPFDLHPSLAPERMA
jgi:glycosyltransferase involved in cell wall biosynthesis